MSAFANWNVVRPKDQWTFNFRLPSRYSDVKFVHAGVQGVVVSAEDRELKRRVAIKRIQCKSKSEQWERRAYEDLSMLAAMRDPNIIPILSAFTPSTHLDEIYLVMELYPFTLYQISVKTRLNHPALSHLVYQCLSAVNYLHRMGIVHGDLKPSNIVVNEQYQLRILDPGLARLIWNQESRLSEFTTERRYQAPEIFLGKKYDGKADVWSIGCIFAQLIRRKPLFPSHHGFDLCATIPTKLSSSMDEIFPDVLFDAESEASEKCVTACQARLMLSRMLSVNPAHRYSVAEAMRDPYVQPWHNQHEMDCSSLVVKTPESESAGELKGMILDVLASFGSDLPTSEHSSVVVRIPSDGRIHSSDNSVTSSSSNPASLANNPSCCFSSASSSTEEAASGVPSSASSGSSRKRTVRYHPFTPRRLYQLPSRPLICSS